MNIEARPGEVWIVDFGLAAKQRPVLILAYPQPDDARALVVVVPLTSQLRRIARRSGHRKAQLAT